MGWVVGCALCVMQAGGRRCAGGGAGYAFQWDHLDIYMSPRTTSHRPIDKPGGP